MVNSSKLVNKANMEPVFQINYSISEKTCDYDYWFILKS